MGKKVSQGRKGEGKHSEGCEGGGVCNPSSRRWPPR